MMNRGLTLAVFTAGTALGYAALAADMPARLELPVAPVLEPIPVSNWSGFYVGGSGAAQLTANTWMTQSVQDPAVTSAPLYTSATARADFGSTNFRPAGHIGYNFQMGNSTVAGIEAEMGGPVYDTHKVQGIPGTYGTGLAFNQGADVDSTRSLFRWDASIRGRFGFLVKPTVLAYATGGVAFASTRYGISCPGVYPAGSWCTAGRQQFNSQSLTGWTIGAGAEAMLTPSWIARIEYRYADYGAHTNTFFSATAADAVTTKTQLRTHTFMFGLPYKFADGFTAPLGSALVAKY